MSRMYFGTDGIRGPAGQYPLDPTGAYRVGKVTGQYFAKPGETVLLGRDPRESSVMLEVAITAGLQATGVRVKLLGVVPTPALIYLTQKSDAAAGVMITASHNPYTDNGIKIVTSNGQKLPDATEEEVDALIETSTATAENDAASQTMEIIEATDASDLVVQYEKFLVVSVGATRFDGLRIAVDTANGSTSGIGQRLFQTLGASVTSLFDQPNGRNINDHCGATHTAALQAAVTSNSLDAGVAFDGDGDRIILVDEKGRALCGDHILYILAIMGQHNGVVATVMSNMGLEKGLKEQGITLQRTNVGDRYVLDGLNESGLTLGGEQSGHIILHDLEPSGDGMLAAIQTLMHVQASGESLAAWYDKLDIWPQKLVNIIVTDKNRLNHPDVQAFIALRQAMFTDSGRLNIRASGTESLVRVMVESADAEKQAQDIADRLADLMANVGN